MANKFEGRILSAMRGKSKPPLSLREIAKRLGVKKSQKQEFTDAVTALKAQNKLVECNGRYVLAESAGLIPALVVKVNATFGFAAPEDGGKDVFIPGRLLAGAMPGDVVLIRRRQGSGELPEGEVFKITVPCRKPFSGVLHADGDGWVVTPDSYVKFPLCVGREGPGGAREGDKVLAELEERGARHSRHTVRILAAYGGADSAAACCKAVLAANGVATEFPPEVLEQARAVGAGSGIHPKELEERLDLRGELIFTIDSADSKDLDDAISLGRTEAGWELGVHIADVSYYVTNRTPLDLEAYERGTSVYYADSVVPMLPEELSNGICSLNPGEDRLAFSALMLLDEQGRLLRYTFRKTVIRSRVKGIYDEVNAILNGTVDEALHAKYGELEPMILLMRELAGVLTSNRFARGGMDIDTVESKILVAPDGTVEKVIARERGESERIIEEFMLAANEAAASLARENGLPFLYRVHEPPATDKLTNLYAILDRLDIKAKRPKGGVTSTQLRDILEKSKGTDAEPVIGTMVLRTMAKAKYAANNIGHFGLALDNYAHFTSPIRRYPDLVVHRILSGRVTGMRPENIKKRFGSFVPGAAAQSTEREIAAMTAERSCEDCYKAEYMTRFIGDEFDGIISGVTAFGVYVRLACTVEGLCSVHGFPAGDWTFDGSIAFVESVTGVRLRLGDAVRVKVTGAHVSAGQVDFVLVSGNI